LDHPIRHQDHSDLRRRMIQLLANSYYVRRSSNIVFVCGGNKNTHMRTKFQQYCREHLQDYEIFFPEFAMESYFSQVGIEPFDIGQFEEVVGDLSHAIVIFPEGPGSFAETGYFSKVSGLYSKTILVLDSRRQKYDSFISLGPAKLINEGSNYHPNIQMNYSRPKFDVISERITRYKPQKTKKSLEIDIFNDLDNFEKISIIHKIVDILSIATIADIVFILRGLSKSRMSESLARKLIAILVGSGYLVPIGEFGHLRPDRSKLEMLDVKDGFVTRESDIRLSLASIYEGYDREFLSLVESSRDVD
jgi:hypothetical protein